MYQKQRGIALLTSIILLLFLALMGLSIMKISMGSIKAAHNDEVSMQTFNQAELALREGEKEVQARADGHDLTDFFTSLDHLYVFPGTTDDSVWTNGASAQCRSIKHHLTER